MTDLLKLEEQFNRMLLEGKAEDAILRFYGADAQIQENMETPIVGKQAILERERQFSAGLQDQRPPVLHSFAVGDDVTFSEWTYDLTLNDGTRIVFNEVARRQWRDGHVVHERFYYSRG